MFHFPDGTETFFDQALHPVRHMIWPDKTDFWSDIVQ